MKVKALIEELSQFDGDANVILINEDTGDVEQIGRVTASEDPPADGSPEVWIVKEDEE